MDTYIMNWSSDSLWSPTNIVTRKDIFKIRHLQDFQKCTATGKIVKK